MKRLYTAGKSDKTEARQAIIFMILLVALMLASLTIGHYPISLMGIARTIVTTPPFHAEGDASDITFVVVEMVRLPRILVVILSGMGLAMAGASMQAVFRNPLVGPEICGVSAGSAFGGVLAILLGWTMWGIVGSAFFFGLVALAIAFGFARLAGNGGMLALILSGIIVGSFFGAALGLLQYLADAQNKLSAITYWLLGSFADASYGKAGVVAVVVLGGGSILMGLRWRLNLLSLGEVDARALGITVQTLRWSVVMVAASIVAAQVSVSGNVGFIGLILPHLARLLVGPEHSRLLPASAFLGGIYLLAIDDIARSVGTEEIPIGLLTSFVGAPVFGFLFWKHKGRGWSHD